MKLCPKSPEPIELARFRSARPDATFEQMKADPHHGGQALYDRVRSQLLRDQRCLCAYCEDRLCVALDDQSVGDKTVEKVVEHFHPKSDQPAATNWGLHWPNLWAVCNGKGDLRPGGDPAGYDQYYPRPANLSCDQFKGHQVTTGRLPLAPEGWLMAPDGVPAFPRLIRYAPNGAPEPDPDGCAAFQPPTNRYPDTHTLVAKTIEHLNLGCPRLNRRRLILKGQLEKRIAFLRQRPGGASGPQAMLALARQEFPSKPGAAWPRFFTFVRWRLGDVADQHLAQIQYAG